jgi:hypothetical protein
MFEGKVLLIIERISLYSYFINPTNALTKPKIVITPLIIGCSLISSKNAIT